MSYESTLRSILQSRNPELFGQLLKIEKNVQGLLSYTQGKFPYFTPHGFSHSLNVEENLNWLLPDNVKEKMNSHEIFFLLVASWMHDWGMVGKSEEDPERIREVHHLRTERYFEEMHEKLFLTEHEGRIIGRICRGHTRENLYSKDFEDFVFGQNIKIRRQFLAAILRMADECDVTCNRTPEIIYYSLNPTGKAKEEFEKHLSISGIGQLDQRHKIYLSAVARDPKGAKALRMVRDKIQSELDTVKGILATNDVILDLVELRLETRGFVDKPIGIEVDKKRIVDLLIGEHLYKRRDVAIRELVQNAIDSCVVKMRTQEGASCKITLRKIAEDTLEIEDDGIGMDYSTAKRFLSVVGASYYSSEEFQQLIEGKNFEPIAKFGIGILSCFLISEGLIIETLKEGEEPCRFTIGPLEEEWKYEKGGLRNTGTKIVLKLNEYGKTIKIAEALQRYFVAPEIEIYYQENAEKLKKFENSWSLDKIVERFSERSGARTMKIMSQELLRFETDIYDVILGVVEDSSLVHLVLFNHGISVGSIRVEGLGYQFIVCVNVKKVLFDLHISRENVVYNEKWSEFLYTLFKELLDRIFVRWQGDLESYFSLLSGMLEGRTWVDATSESELSKEMPFLRSFFDTVLFPVVVKSKIDFQKLSDILKSDEITVYSSCSHKPLQEIELLSGSFDQNRITLFNPYKMPKVKSKIEPEKCDDALLFLLKARAKKLRWLDLNSMLVDRSVLCDEHFEDILPSNVKLVNFPKYWKPLVMVKQPAKILKEGQTLGSAYWGNILLWQNLIGDKEVTESSAFLGAMKRHVESVKLLREPTLYIDADDDFIKRILEQRRKKSLDEKTTKNAIRYFKYLSFLPLAMSDMCSSLIFFEVLGNLEREIADALEFDNPDPLLKRIKPSFSLYLDYFDNCEEGILYLEESARE